MQEQAISQRATTWLRRCAHSMRPWLLASAGLGVLAAILMIVQAGFLAHVLHAILIAGESTAGIEWPLLGFAVAVMARAAAIWAQERTSFEAGARIREQTRTRLLERLLALGPLTVANKSTGALTSSALEQVEALQNYVARYLPQQVIAIAVPVCIVAAIMPRNWLVALVLLGTAPLVPLFMVLVGSGAAAANRRQFRALERLSARLLDSLQGAAMLKLLGAAEAEANRIVTASEELRRRTLSVVRIAFLSSAVLEFFASVSIALVAVYLGLSLLGRLDIGHYGTGVGLETALFALVLAPEFYNPLRQLGSHYHARAQAMGAAEAILSAADSDLSAEPETSPASQAASGRMPVPAGALDIEVSDLVYTYPGESRPILDGVCLSIVANQHVVLRGPSGAGKSTLVSLILSFAQPTSGRILVGGIDLAALDPAAWHRQVAWLNQRPALFHGTLTDNIRLAVPEASQQAVKEAAERAGVSEFAHRLPRGLHTAIGEGGLSLSGGQAQRVALARAFLKDAPLLLLDEPTASLDESTGRQILQAISAFGQHKTVISVSHLSGTTVAAQRVLWLAEGRIQDRAPDHTDSLADPS